jgi:hypothetical protein
MRHRREAVPLLMRHFVSARHAGNYFLGFPTLPKTPSIGRVHLQE